mmetsp:Transcript_22840/g.22553  ORF Transcript_22840/g.22553 Transcript_22840/m.22553 type:complete len:141 (+) Transcript_22840:1-423(+)
MGWYASWVRFGVGVVVAPAVWILMRQYRKNEDGCLPFMIINDTDLDVKCYTYYASDTVQFISLSSHDCAQWGMLELPCKEHAELKFFRFGVTRAGRHLCDRVVQRGCVYRLVCERSDALSEGQYHLRLVPRCALPAYCPI